MRPAGLNWLHVHPEHVVTEDSWAVVRLASNWRDGRLPGPGGVLDQSAWTAEAVEIVLGVWSRMLSAKHKKED